MFKQHGWIWPIYAEMITLAFRNVDTLSTDVLPVILEEMTDKEVSEIAVTAEIRAKKVL